MITENKLKTLSREARRRRKLGDEPVCTLCGESGLSTLMRTKRLTEEHHVGGRANDAQLVTVLCLNCHHKAHEKQRRFGVELCHAERHPIEKLVNVMKGLASFFQLLADVLLDWAAKMSEFILQLNGHYPDWRTRTTRK